MVYAPDSRVPSEYSVPRGVTNIRPYAYSDCYYLKKLALPDTVTTIGDSAFSGCVYLEEITIPDTVTSIGVDLFNDDELTIYGYEGSTAQSYAIDNNITFVALNGKYVCSMEIYTEPTKTTYCKGESFDSTGLQLKVVYGDGLEAIVTDGFEISNFDSTNIGFMYVTVTYQGFTDTFRVDIINKQNASLSISTTSMSLNVGETGTIIATATPSGQTVTWTSSNTSVASVSGGTITAKASGYATITAKFTYNGITYSKTCSVTVISAPNPEPTLSSISIATKPTKTSYKIGEPLNTSGLTLKLTYSDGSTKTISSGFTTSGFSSTTAGTKTVTVSYGGKNTSFTVTVNEPEPDIDKNAPQIVLESKKVTIGKEFTVAVELKNNPGFNAASIKIEYDNKKLQLINAELSEVFSTGANVSYDNLPYLTFIRSNDVSDDAEFLILSFKALDVGDVKLSIGYEKGDISNSKEEDINFKVVGGDIKIAQYTPGDINDDGKVNTKDLTRLLKYINHEDVEYNEQALDVNGDGKVNTKDLTRLLRYINRENVEIF